jgi:hypothetical protein
MIPDALLAHLAPVGWQHINLTGDYLWDGDIGLAPDGFRPLRSAGRNLPSADAAWACFRFGPAYRAILPVLCRDPYPSEIILEWRAKSSRNAERHQIGMVSDIIADSRATSSGIRNSVPHPEPAAQRPCRRMRVVVQPTSANTFTNSQPVSHRIMTIATLRPDGWPQATTVGYAREGLTLFFLCGLNSQKAANLARDDRVSLTIDHDTPQVMEIARLSMAAHAPIWSSPYGSSPVVFIKTTW